MWESALANSRKKNFSWFCTIWISSSKSILYQQFLFSIFPTPSQPLCCGRSESVGAPRGHSGAWSEWGNIIESPPKSIDGFSAVLSMKCGGELSSVYDLRRFSTNSSTALQRDTKTQKSYAIEQQSSWCQLWGAERWDYMMNLNKASFIVYGAHFHVALLLDTFQECSKTTRGEKISKQKREEFKKVKFCCFLCNFRNIKLLSCRYG